MIRMIHADNPDADRIPSGSTELACLLNEVANDPVNLLDHRLCEYLHLRADLNSGNWTPSADKARHPFGSLVRDQLAKCSIAATGLDAMSTVLNVEHTQTGISSGV